MALVTTIADASADSYVTVEEADSYILVRWPGDSDDWFSLSVSEKEDRLRVGAMMLDSLPLRGIKATLVQALAFPRIFPGSELWPTDGTGTVSDDPAYRYVSWEEVTVLADALGVDAPTIPDAVKKAQIETTFLYVVYMFNLAPDSSGAGGVSVSYVQTGDFAVTVRQSPAYYQAVNLWQRSVLTPGSVIYYLMKPYLGKIRGFAV